MVSEAQNGGEYSLTSQDSMENGFHGQINVSLVPCMFLYNGVTSSPTWLNFPTGNHYNVLHFESLF